MLFCPATLLPWALMKPPVQLATPGLLIACAALQGHVAIGPGEGDAAVGVEGVARSRRSFRNSGPRSR